LGESKARDATYASLVARGDDNYTIGDSTDRVDVDAIADTRQFALAHDQNPRTEPTSTGGAAWPRNRHAARSAGSGVGGNAAAAVVPIPVNYNTGTYTVTRDNVDSFLPPRG